MLTLIYPYRNRNIERVKRSLDSLKNQRVKDFSVQFVDYGSASEIASEVDSLLKNYDFVNYQYYPNVEYVTAASVCIEPEDNGGSCHAISLAHPELF